MKKPNTLQQAIKYFADEDVCIRVVAEMRWPYGVECPACGHKEHYHLKKQRRWKCKDCHRQFSVKLGTIFEDSPIPLDKWLVALWMLVNCRNGVSSYEVHRAIGVTQKSAWFVLHRLRLAMQNKSIGKLSGEVEADETYIGGRARNMHYEKRKRMTSSPLRKAAVMGVLERGGKVRAKVIPTTSQIVVRETLKENVEQGAELFTDAHPAYFDLNTDYIHKVIDHAKKYVDGKVHTNGIENFWSLLKRGLKGTYVAVEPFHLFRYLDEQMFRYNNRKDEDDKPLKDGDRFFAALSQIAGKRLTFAEVTGKVGGACC